MDMIAHRSVRCVQRGGQLAGREPIELRHRPERAAFGNDPVDPTLVGPGADVEGGEPLRADPARVLDHEPVHIHHPERTVGTRADLHRADTT